jgi:hypothetical protein
MPKISLVRDFSRNQDRDKAVVRVFNLQLQKLGGRNAWVRISSGNSTIFRRVLGSGEYGLSANAIELDYDSRLELDELGTLNAEGYFECPRGLNIQRTSLYDRFRAHWYHPNVEYRAPYQIAVIGLTMGIIGLILGVISLFH